MIKVILRQGAIDDLSDIWRYTVRRWSKGQANKYYATIKSACEVISLHPYIGKQYTTIRKNLFGLRSGKHVIFYEIISEHELEVIRILHESMDLPSKLLGG